MSDATRRRGSRAIYILAPKISCVKKEDEEDKIVKGFMAVAVFRYEDTDGEPIIYPKLKLPDLPLLAKAKEWGISVNAVEGNEEYYGYYSHSRKEIALATEAECKVFFHELAHASHSRD